MKYEVIAEFVSRTGKRVKPADGTYETTRERGERLVRAKCLRELPEAEKATAPKAEKATARRARKSRKKAKK